MDPSFVACVVAGNSIAREGLSRILSDSGFRILQTASHVDLLVAGGEADTSIVVADYAYIEAGLIEHIADTRERFPGSRIIIIKESFDLALMSSIFAAGAHGYVLKDVPYQTFIAMVRLVAMGEKVAPSTLIDVLQHLQSRKQQSQDPAGSRILGLNNRERQILNCLALGHTNKMIARDLAMTEATVKLAVKTLFRRLSVNNRTQAAILARQCEVVPSSSALADTQLREYGDLPDPAVKCRTVLIRVHAISIEGGDLLNRRITPPPVVPHVGGYQAAGIVEAVGEDVTRFRVGDAVVGFNWQGSHAALFAVPEHYAYPLPEGIDLDVAATVPVTFGTASDALFEFGGLQPGETVLIQGGAGGVGLAAVQLARRAGARVIVTASSTERLERLAGFGADEGIDYRSEDIGDRVLALTDGQGCDLVLDLAGGKSIDQLMRAVRYRGRFAVVGASSGDLPAFQFFDLIRKSLHLFGISFGREMEHRRAHDLLAGLISDVASGALTMPIERVFSLADAPAAHAFVENGHPFGRVLMRP